MSESGLDPFEQHAEGEQYSATGEEPESHVFVAADQTDFRIHEDPEDDGCRGDHERDHLGWGETHNAGESSLATVTTDGTNSGITETLGIEPGMTVVILHEPNWFHYDLGDLPEGVTVHRDSDEQLADLFVVFAASLAEAERGIQRVLTVLPPHGALWIVWERDPPDDGDGLDEEMLKELLADSGMVDDKATVIDDTWQGLRFLVAEENRELWEEIRQGPPVKE